MIPPAYPPIVDYKLVRAVDVKAHLADGWTLYGNPFVVYELREETSFLYQAMVQFEVVLPHVPYPPVDPLILNPG